MIEDAGSRDQLAPLLRFVTSKSGDDMTSLSDYVSRCTSRQTPTLIMAELYSVKGLMSKV